MAFLRPLLERASRGRVLRRRLPPELGAQPLYVTPDAALSFWLPGVARADPLLLRLAGELVAPGATVWDIGANVGLFTFAAAFLAGRSGEVVAVEPDDWLAGLLRRSAAEQAPDRAPVHVLAAAASDRNGISELCIARRGRAASHLAEVPGSSQAGGTREARPVRTVTLDGLLDTFKPPTLVKIDVEGAELGCLRGATVLLAEVRPRILCEVGRDAAAAVGELLGRHGYQLFDAAAASGERRPLDSPAWNTLALPVLLARPEEAG